MGVSLTTFSNGDVMDPAAVTTNFETLRNWMNGGITTADIATGTVPSRAFRRLDHFGAVNKRSTGVSGTTLRDSVSDDPIARVYATGDSHGPGQWEDIATMQHRIYCEDDGYVEGVWEWWCWQIQSDYVDVAEEYKACEWRILFNDTDLTAAHRELYDAGHSDPTGTDGGQFLYPARNLQVVFQRPVLSGWNNIKLQVKVNNLGSGTADRPHYGLIIIGARQKHLEYWRNT